MSLVVGRKKKDSDRVGYNLSRVIRAAVLREADRQGWNEVDAVEDLLRHGLAAKAMLRDGTISYSEFTRKLDSVIEDRKEPKE